MKMFTMIAIQSSSAYNLGAIDDRYPKNFKKFPKLTNYFLLLLNDMIENKVTGMI